MGPPHDEEGAEHGGQDRPGLRRVHAPEHELTDQLAVAVEKALRRVLADEQLRRDFWKAGYQEMSQHATSGAVQWVGRRILSAIGGALLALGIWVGFKFGGWGK
jgi:uncharacterized protein YaaW (UPF0174 family)